jgi:hypothetical protein
MPMAGRKTPPTIVPGPGREHATYRSVWLCIESHALPMSPQGGLQ